MVSREVIIDRYSIDEPRSLFYKVPFDSAVLYYIERERSITIDTIRFTVKYYVVHTQVRHQRASVICASRQRSLYLWSLSYPKSILFCTTLLCAFLDLLKAPKALYIKKKPLYLAQYSNPHIEAAEFVFWPNIRSDMRFFCR